MGELGDSEIQDSNHGVPALWAYVALGVGIAGLATGGITGGLALSKKSTLDDKCGPTHRTCPSRGSIDDMNQYADISSIGFAVGIAGVGTALGLYLWGSPTSSKPAAAASRERTGSDERGGGDERTGSGRRSSRRALVIAPNRITFSGEF